MSLGAEYGEEGEGKNDRKKRAQVITIDGT